MPSFLFKVQKKYKAINPIVWETGNGKTMLFSKCAISDSKKSKIY